MTPRYRHWIQPANEGRWPSAVVCVDCVGVCSPSDRTGNRATERLVSWHAVLAPSYQGEYLVDFVTSGTIPESLWQLLSSFLEREPNLLVVSNGCNRVWSLLKLWERIEDGRINLYDLDHRDSEARRQREANYRRRQADPLRALSGEERSRLAGSTGGFLVCEDPPNILRCRLHGACYGMSWIDIRNHGIEAPAAVGAGEQTARWLGATVSRMAVLCRQYGLTALKATAGGQAMNAWRHSYLNEGVYVHTDRSATDLESAAYFGGRCEARRVGVVGGAVYHLDFRSQYGRICADSYLPTGLLDYRDCNGLASAINERSAHCSAASVTIETDEPAYPVRRDHDVIYPVGRYRTVLCGLELADAISLGRVRAVHAVASYRMGYALGDYALRLYDMRVIEGSAGNTATEQWAKRLIVSLPGRLGQRNHRWIDAPDVIPPSQYGEWYGHDEEGEPIRYRAIGGIVQRDTCDGYAADSVPAIAAWVTSAGRMRLLGAIRCAGWDNVYYYDTDSLFVNELGYQRLLSSEYMAFTGLGALTLRSTPAVLDIRGIKYYVEDSRIVCAGLARGTAVDNGDGHSYSRHLSALEQARRGERPESVVVSGEYTRAEAYAAGDVQPDGSVRPFRLLED